MRLKKLFENPIFWGVVIFIAAGFFRLLFLDLTEALPDPAISTFEVVRFFKNPHLFTKTDVRVTPGFYYFPLALYIFVLLALPSRHPLAITFMIALFNTASIVFFYWWVRRFYGNAIAVIASLFLSFSTWSIIFSRTVWVPDLMLPFSIFFLYFAHKIFLEKDKKSALWLGISAALLIQIHPPGLSLVVPTIGVLLIGLRKRVRQDFSSYKKMVLGMVLGFIFAIPYVIDFIKPTAPSPWVVDLQKNLRFSATFQLTHFGLPFFFMTGIGLDSYIGKSWQDFIRMFPYIRFIQFVFFIEMIFPLISIYYIFRNKKELRFLIFIILIASFMFFISKSHPNRYYNSPTSPIVAILIALSANYAVKIFPFLSKKIVIASLLFIIVVHFIFEASFYAFLNRKEHIGGQYGEWIFRKTEKFVSNVTSQYASRDDYDLIKGVAYVYSSQQDVFYQRMGEYFAQTGEPYFAIEEYKKQLSLDEKNVGARANLSYIYIVTGDYQRAKREIDMLSTYQASVAADLRRILDQTKIQNSEFKIKN